MPHLSPMNWIISIVSFWMLLSILSSLYWWSQSMKFNYNKSSFSLSSSSMKSWKWLL